MPRIKASPKKCVKTSNSHPAANSWVFLMKGNNILFVNKCQCNKLILNLF